MKLDWLKTDMPSLETILKRLKMIISRELDPNGYIIREIGAKTVYVMLHCFCVGGEKWIRPATITCMNDEEAAIIDEHLRLQWLDIFQSRKSPKDVPDRWYMPNTREPIRDETLREMVRLGAVIEREGLPTTSPLPRYSLQKNFAELFNPNLNVIELAEAITKWQKDNLSGAALARIALSKRWLLQMMQVF